MGRVCHGPSLVWAEMSRNHPYSLFCMPCDVILSVTFNIISILPVPIAQMVERLLREREVVGSIPGRATPKALKWYQWLPCLALSIIRQALALLSLTTNIAQ